MSEIPNKEYTTNRIHEGFDSKDFIKNIYKYIKENDGEEAVYKYFSDVYDNLFANLALKKTFISNDTRKMLELLATPIYKKDEIEKQKSYAKIENT